MFDARKPLLEGIYLSVSAGLAGLFAWTVDLEATTSNLDFSWQVRGLVLAFLPLAVTIPIMLARSSNKSWRAPSIYSLSGSILSLVCVILEWSWAESLGHQAYSQTGVNSNGQDLLIYASWFAVVIVVVEIVLTAVMIAATFACIASPPRPVATSPETTTSP